MTTAETAGTETTRERILRVAAELFAERGYHGTSVSDLGVAANIKRGALYYHIGSKEELLFDLSKRHVEEALARGTAVVEKNLHPIDKLRALAREHVESVAARRAEVTIVMREMHTLTGERAVQLKALRHKHQDLFRRVLEEGVERGVFRSYDSITVLGIMGLYNWTHIWLDPVNGPLSVAEVADRLTDSVLYGQLLMPPDASRSGE
ncbi:transcriptional regulator, TetR family [Prauserella sp. Am3]|nr:transcriptional regulator, TetR family [Prauserella sp. Am3]